MNESSTTIGFIGLGTMGAPMARNLIGAGYHLQVYDIDENALGRFRETEARICASIEEAVAGAKLVITMLPDSPQVEAAAAGPDGVLACASAGQIVIDMSTISPIVTRRIAARFDERGIAFLDAPVSGGEQGAKAGKLSIMVGGARSAFESALPALSVMGSTVTFVGASGSGQVAKLANQIACAVNIQAVCEAFTFGRRMGLDLPTLREVMMGGAAASWMLDTIGGKILDDDMSAGFRVDLQLKDLRLALESAFTEGIALPGAALVSSLYLEARGHGEGSNGHQGLYRVYQRLSPDSSLNM